MTNEERMGRARQAHDAWMRARKWLSQAGHQSYAQAVIVQRRKKELDELRAGLPRPRLVVDNTEGRT